MYKLNEWKKERKIESQADTYIERHFEEACLYLNNGSHILNEWRCRKSRYIAYTNTTIFDFQHYSRHDESHSVNILESIELALGKKRIKKLSAGDLWLLLEGAYFHDIGMSLTYEDLVKIWKTEELKEYIQNCVTQWEPDQKSAANWYLQIDNLLKNRAKMEGIEKEKEIEFSAAWPVELERRLLFLVGEYIRKGHPKRSELFLSRFSVNSQGAIPQRLYELVVNISVAHGEDFEYLIKELKEEQKGFGIDKVHPRFVAALLRLGDLLDMDNNRFDARAVEHYGELPWSSELHLKKHKAMCHILITPEKLEAEAKSEELEVCRVTNDWFRYIKDEVKNLIAYWNEMAPKELGGCIMQQANCVVYHPKSPAEFRTTLQKRFEVDKAKLTDLLIGTNIYDVKMDFLREYIQNALDASKMRIWMQLQEGKYQSKINPSIIEIEKLAPFDLSWRIYEEYAIEIKVELDMKWQEVELTIVDHGIGMEEDCINAMSRIGSGWRERKSFREQISKMLKWLKPTGGFGIGVQSAFMVADQVEITTKSDDESYGHRIRMNSPRTTGEIVEEIVDRGNQRGTSVKVKIPLQYFQEWNNEYYEWNRRRSEEDRKKGRKNSVQGILGIFDSKLEDVFDEDATLDYIINFLERYLSCIICNSFIPIHIVNSKRNTVICRSRYVLSEDYWLDLKEKRFLATKLSDEQGDYQCVYDLNEKAMLLWNQTECVYTYVKQNFSRLNEHILAFKNICVTRDNDFYLPYGQYFEICVDFMGHSSEKTLKVHRNSFNESFSVNKYLESSMRAYFKGISELAETDEELRAALWAYPVPIIRKLYFDDVDITRTRAVSGQSIYISEYKFTVLPDESISSESVRISSERKAVSLGAIMGILAPFLSGDRNHVLFTGRIEQERGGESTRRISIMKSVIADWMKRPNDSINDEKGKEDEETRILREFQKNRFWVIESVELQTLLAESGKFEQRPVNMGELAFTMLAWKQEEKAKEKDEKVFLKKMYEAPGNMKRYIASDTETTGYDKLFVSEVPYNMFISESGLFLISPVDESVRHEISLILRRKAVYSFKEFETLITQNDSYSALIKWVYEHQADKKKYKEKEIDEAYRKLAEDIYRFLGLAKLRCVDE